MIFGLSKRLIGPMVCLLNSTPHAFKERTISQGAESLCSATDMGF